MNLALILPEITLFCGALLILMLDVFFASKIKNFFCFSHLIGLLVCFLTIGFIIQNFTINSLAFNNMFETNSFTSLVKSFSVLLLAIIMLFSFDFISKNNKISAEFLALIMIATSGAMILVSANDFITFYLGLELQALPLYLLAAINRKSAQSSEAGMKYFILGCLASGILLFGISMIYGFAGTTNFTTLMDLYHYNKAATSVIPVTVMFGFIMVISAMFFKIAAAPFHMWSPDVYQGSDSCVTAFFATVAKFGVVMALLKLFATVIIGWSGIEKIFTFTAILSLAVGSFGAIFQTNLKRLLAYSSVGHIGFVLLGIASFGKAGFASTIFYMIIYSIISLGSFGFLTLMQLKKSNNDSDKNNDKIFNINSLAGLAKTNPVMAFSLAILMFSSAGVPPLAGFFSKFYILAALMSYGFLITAIIAVLFSVISAYYYLRIVKIMYFDKAQVDIELRDNKNAKAIIFFSAIFNLTFIFFLKDFMILIANFLTF